MNDQAQLVENFKVAWSKAESALVALHASKIQLFKAEEDWTRARERVLLENKDTPEKLGKNESMREASLNQLLDPLVTEVSRLEIEVMEKNAEWLRCELSWKTWKSILDSTRPQ